VEGLTHRELQSHVLGIPAPQHGGGFEAMYILHYYGVGGEDTRGLLSNISSEDTVESIIETRLIKFSEEQRKGIRQAWLRYQWGVEAARAIRENGHFECGNEQDGFGRARNRRYQRRLREIVLENYDWTCALCDVKDLELLEASHIKPYRIADDDRNKPSNMLSLCTFHHRLFDLGWISIAVDRTIIVSERLETSSCLLLKQRPGELRKLREPKSYLPAPEFLEFHRRHCFVDGLK